MDALRTLLNEKHAEAASGPKIAIEYESTTFGAIGGVVLEPGKHRVEVFERGLREIESLVETELDKVRQALEHHERHRERVLAEKKNDLSFEPSFEGSFRLLHGRDVRPLKSVKRIEDGKAKKTAA
jgi:hypothetical protein